MMLINQHCDFFEQHPDLFAAPAYTVQSNVALDIFRVFVGALETNTKIDVTRHNAASLALLAAEFSFPALAAECAQILSIPDSSSNSDYASLFEDRISKLERHIASFLRADPRSLQEQLDNQEKQIEFLLSRLSPIESEMATVRRWLASSSERRPSEPAVLVPVRSFCFSEKYPFDGIFAYLSGKCGKNVDDAGIVKIF